MPDVAMCRGEGCAVKHLCYRHVAKPSQHLQAYLSTPPGRDASCDYFWPTDTGTHEAANREYDDA